MVVLHMTTRRPAWILTARYSVLCCVLSWLVSPPSMSRLPPALLIPSTASNVPVSEICKAVLQYIEHEVPLCFQGTNSGDQRLRNLEASWNFSCRCFAGTSDPRASKTCSPSPCVDSTASSLIHYKSSVVSNPHSSLFPGQCKWSLNCFERCDVGKKPVAKGICLVKSRSESDF